MELRRYKIIGRHNITNKSRSIYLDSVSEEDALILATSRNLKEIKEIKEVVYLPTVNQLNYAKSLNIKIDDDFTFYDVSALITRNVDEESNPKPELVDFANTKKLSFSKYIGEQSLYNLIFQKLEGVDKTTFFIFSIYIWLADEKFVNPDNHPLIGKFHHFASSVNEDEQFLKSMNKYSGTDLIYFGEITQKDGNVIAYGSSTDTIAYKKVANFLSQEFGVFKTRNKKAPYSIKKEQLVSKGKGCLVLVLLFFVILIPAFSFIHELFENQI